MVQTLGSCIGISKKNEVLLMTITSICFNIFDMSLFQLGSNMEQIWNVNIDKDLFSETAQHNLKSFISLIVIIRSFTLHLYTTLSVALLWPAIYADRPGICIPWLAISGIKNLGTSLMSCAAGLFICASYGGYRPACLIFSLTQVWDIVPSLYMWAVVLSYYRELKKPRSVDVALAEKIEEMEMLMAVKRRKVRSLTAEAILRKQIENRRKFTGTSALGLEDFCKASSFENCDKGSRSLDSLLEGIANEAECMEADSSSGSFAEQQIELEEGMTPSQKTMRLLGITESQVNLAKRERMTPKEDLPRMNVKYRKSMYISDLANICKCKYAQQKSELTPKTDLGAKSSVAKCAANAKQIRPVKSELKGSELANHQAPLDFLNSVEEREVRIISIHSLLPPQSITPSISDTEGLDQPVKKKSNEIKSRLPKRIFKVPKQFNLDNPDFRVKNFIRKFRKNNDLKQVLPVNNNPNDPTKQNPKLGTAIKNFFHNYDNFDESCKFHFIDKEENSSTILYDSIGKDCASSNESIYDLDKNLDQRVQNLDPQYFSKTSSVLPDPRTRPNAFDPKVQDSSDWSTSSSPSKKFNRKIKNLFGKTCFSEQMIECEKIKPNKLPILVEIKDSAPIGAEEERPRTATKETNTDPFNGRDSKSEECQCHKKTSDSTSENVTHSCSGLPTSQKSKECLPDEAQEGEPVPMKTHEISDSYFYQSHVLNMPGAQKESKSLLKPKSSKTNFSNRLGKSLTKLKELPEKFDSRVKAKKISKEKKPKPESKDKSKEVKKTVDSDALLKQKQELIDKIDRRLEGSQEKARKLKTQAKNLRTKSREKTKELKEEERVRNLAKEKFDRMRMIGRRFTFFNTKHGRKNLEEVEVSRRSQTPEVPKVSLVPIKESSRPPSRPPSRAPSRDGSNKLVIFQTDPSKTNLVPLDSGSYKSACESMLEAARPASKEEGNPIIFAPPILQQVSTEASEEAPKPEEDTNPLDTKDSALGESLKTNESTEDNLEKKILSILERKVEIEENGGGEIIEKPNCVQVCIPEDTTLKGEVEANQEVEVKEELPEAPVVEESKSTDGEIEIKSTNLSSIDVEASLPKETEEQMKKVAFEMKELKTLLIQVPRVEVEKEEVEEEKPSIPSTKSSLRSDVSADSSMGPGEDSLDKLKKDIEYATKKIVTKIKNPSIRDLCSKLLTAISNCEETCSSTDIEALVEAKGSDKDLLQKTFSRRRIINNVLSKAILCKLGKDMLKKKYQLVIEELPKKFVQKEKVCDRISRTCIQSNTPPMSANTSEFGCQASTLSRKILNTPPDEMTRKLKESSFQKKKNRTIILQRPASSATEREPKTPNLEKIIVDVNKNITASKQILRELEGTCKRGGSSSSKRSASYKKLPEENSASNRKNRSPSRRAHNKEDLVIITGYASELGYNFREHSASRKKRLKSWTAT